METIYEKVETALRAALTEANRDLSRGQIEAIVHRHLEPLKLELDPPKSRPVGFGT